MIEGMESFLDHLAEAIRIPTVSSETGADPAPFDRFHQFLAATYRRTWAALSPETVAGHALLATWPGTDRRLDPIVLMAHQDVVPIDVTSSWTHQPFAGERSATHLYGRGTLDDKGSLIAILEAVEGLLGDGHTPRRTMLLAFGHDEEAPRSGGAAAIAALLGERGVRPHLVLDEGGWVTEGVVPLTRRPLALVGIAEKGYLTVELSAAGTTGHSSRPPRTTAVGAVAAAVAALERRQMPATTDVIGPLLAAAARAASPLRAPVLRLAARGGPLSTRLLGRDPTANALVRTTTAATLIEGGIKSNVLPASARAQINFRLLPGDTIEGVLAHVDRVAGDRVIVRVVEGSEASSVSDQKGDAYRLVERTINRVFPDAVVAPWVVIGGTDSRHFTSICDSVLRFSPFRGTPDELAGFHGVDERIRLADAGPAVEFYRALITAA
jgi:carboxypeptidase PM20D1